MNIVFSKAKKFFKKTARETASKAASKKYNILKSAFATESSFLIKYREIATRIIWLKIVVIAQPINE